MNGNQLISLFHAFSLLTTRRSSGEVKNEWGLGRVDSVQTSTVFTLHHHYRGVVDEPANLLTCTLADSRAELDWL